MTRSSIILLVFISVMLGCTSDLAEPEQLYTEIALPDLIDEPLDAGIPEIDQVYGWVTRMQHNNGLLESAEETDFVSLYDNALAALLFMAKGDFQRAEKVFDFFQARTDSELLNGNGGFHQFRNTSGGNPRRVWLGDNAWLLIALNNYRALTQSTKYDDLATELENWIRSLQDQNGALSGGFNQDGTPIGTITEGIITAFNAVPGFDDFHLDILKYLQQERWDSSELLLLTQKGDPKYGHALDLHSLGFMIFENFPATVLEQADRYRNVQYATVPNVEIEGYCFDKDVDVIWLEGTAQMALARGQAQHHQARIELIIEMEKNMIPSVNHPEVRGLPYTSNQGTSFGAVALWDHADLRPALSSSIWYLFSKLQFNPFLIEKPKAIPAGEQFWNPVM
jgi:hypothetical protein